MMCSALASASLDNWAVCKLQVFFNDCFCEPGAIATHVMVSFSACFCEPGSDVKQNVKSLSMLAHASLDQDLCCKLQLLFGSCFCEPGADSVAIVNALFSACFCEPGSRGVLFCKLQFSSELVSASLEELKKL